MNFETIVLGSELKDRITGFTGIAVAKTVWLNGCTRVTLQPRELKDGKPIESYTVDTQDLVFVSDGVAASDRKTGGPQDDRAALRR